MAMSCENRTPVSVIPGSEKAENDVMAWPNPLSPSRLLRTIDQCRVASAALTLFFRRVVAELNACFRTQKYSRDISAFSFVACHFEFGPACQIGTQLSSRHVVPSVNESSFFGAQSLV